MTKKPIDDLVSRSNDLDDSQGNDHGGHLLEVDQQGLPSMALDAQAAEMDMWIEAGKDNYQEAKHLRTELLKTIDTVMERQTQNVNNIDDLEPDTLGQALDTSTKQGVPTPGPDEIAAPFVPGGAVVSAAELDEDDPKPIDTEDA